jgi:hypothetical protein
MPMEESTMPSPFPGMNPYLESPGIWHGFHQRFVTAMANQLTAQLRPQYIVLLEENIYLHEIEESERLHMGRADVAVAESGHSSTKSATATVEAPVVGVLAEFVDEEHLGYIEIRERESRELVTVVELLSPANKRPGADREQYLHKRRRLLRSPTHLVEIDLLRTWPRMPVEHLPACDYLLFASRAETRPQVGLWPCRLREPLPPLRVPLRAMTSCELDLQSLLHQVYDEAGYEDYLYATPIDPPLSPADAAWAAELVNAARSRL